MGYIYNAAAIRELTQVTTSSAAKWLEAISGIRQTAAYIADGEFMSGTGAQNLKDYLACVHLNSICGALSTTLATLEAFCREYYAKYLKEVSDKCDELVNTDEIETLQRVLKDIHYHINQVEADIKSVMNSIQGVTKQAYSGLGADIPSLFSTAIKQLGTLVESIASIETQSSQGLEGVEASIAAIRRIVYASCSSDASITEFSMDAFQSSHDFSALYTAMEAVAAQYTAIESRSGIIDGLIADVEKQWEQREAIATAAKFGLAILETAIIAVAAVTLTPAGAVCIGAAFGAINGVVSEGVQQWSTGELAVSGGFDFASIAYEGVKGAAKGGLSAGMGAAFAPIKAVASPLGKAGLTFTSNFAGDLLDAPFELLETASEEGFDAAWKRVTSNEYAVEMVGKCALNAAVDTTLDGYTSKLTDAYSVGSSAFEQHLGEFVSGGVENVITSKAEDLVDTAVEAFVPDDETMATELSMNSHDRRRSYAERIVTEVIPASWETLIDGSDVATNFIQGGAENMVPSIVEDTPLIRDRVNTAIQHDSRLQNATGPMYSSYHQSYTGEHVVFDTDDVEVILLDSDPDISVMKDIAREYIAPVKTATKAASKLLTHETHDVAPSFPKDFRGFDFNFGQSK